MKRKNRIKKILSNNLKSWKIEVIDISFQHKGHHNISGKDETHISIILYPKERNKYKRLEIHKQINYLLKNEFSSGLHALEIKIKN